jgi:hypothetical protein
MVGDDNEELQTAPSDGWFSLTDRIWHLHYKINSGKTFVTYENR